MKICNHCGDYFVPKHANLKLCFDCYRKREQALAEYDDLKRELRTLRAENERLYDQLVPLVTQPKQTGIPRELIPTMICLCHPDKHGGSKAANDATRWLLEQRRLTARASPTTSRCSARWKG
jgi:hypothetical protein